MSYPPKVVSSHQTGWGVPSGTNRRRLIEVEGMASRWVRLANGARGHYMTSDTTGPAVVPLYGGLPGSSGTPGWRFTAPFLGANGLPRVLPRHARIRPVGHSGRVPGPTACTAMRTSSMSSPLRCACMVPCRRQLDGLLEHGELR